MRKHKISAFVITKNEEDRIEDCLKSIYNWVDQLIVMDSGSNDNTVKIAKRYTEEIYQTDWPGYGKQRNRALKKCLHDWVLTIDADERLSDGAKKEIDNLFSKENLPYTMIKFPWQTYFLKKPLHYGRFSTPQGKLFHQREACFNDGAVHEQIVMPKRICYTTKSPLEHYSWRDYQHLQCKHLEYAHLQAKERYHKGQRASISQAILSSCYCFFWQYLIRLGFINGRRGFIIAMTLAHYEMHRYFDMICQDLENNKVL